MKKAIKLLLLLLFFEATSFAQISIDSVNVFLGAQTQWGGLIVDSVYIEGNSTGPTFKSFTPAGAQFNDLCGTIVIGLFFEGCDTTPSTYSQIIPIGFDTERIIFYAIWDTLTGCSLPTSAVATDTLIWSNCFTSSLSEKNQANNLKIAPNPASNQIQITFEKTISIDAIALHNINGKLVRQFNSNERTFDVQQLNSGIYFLKVESNEGVVTKKIVIQH